MIDGLLSLCNEYTFYNRKMDLIHRLGKTKKPNIQNNKQTNKKHPVKIIW